VPFSEIPVEFPFVKRSPAAFKEDGEVIVPRVVENCVVPVMEPNAAMSGPSPVVVLSQATQPEGVPLGATAVQFRPLVVQVPPVVRLVPEVAVHQTVAA
jgi:hypothetical protein